MCFLKHHTANNTPHAYFTYLSIIPCLCAMIANSSYATKSQYRAKHQHDPFQVTDLFDSTHYCALLTMDVVVGDEKLPFWFFSDPWDIALGLLTDGFELFKHHTKTAWPIILFNYNLPSEERFWKDNIISVGVIPGLKKSCDFDSFLWPLVQELHQLAIGIQAFNSLSKSLFFLYAYVILGFGDIPAVSMMMWMKGHNAKLPCHICEIKGIQNNTSKIPLNQDNFSSASPRQYNLSALPLHTHKRLIQQAEEVQNAVMQLLQIGLQPCTASKAYLFWAAWPLFLSQLRFLMTLCISSGPTSFQTSSLCGQETLRILTIKMRVIYFWRVHERQSEQQQLLQVILYLPWLGPNSSILLQMHPMYPPKCVLFGHCTLHLLYYAIGFNNNNFINIFFIWFACSSFAWNSNSPKNKLMNLRKDSRIGWRTTRGISNLLYFHPIDWHLPRFYYQHDPLWVVACSVMIHALLHIASSIRVARPVWAYWAFLMEHYCEELLLNIKSHHHPYKSLNHYVTTQAHLMQIKLLYNLYDELSLQLLPPHCHDFSLPWCKSI